MLSHRKGRIKALRELRPGAAPVDTSPSASEVLQAVETVYPHLIHPCSCCGNKPTAEHMSLCFANKKTPIKIFESVLQEVILDDGHVQVFTVSPEDDDGGPATTIYTIRLHVIIPVKVKKGDPVPELVFQSWASLSKQSYETIQMLSDKARQSGDKQVHSTLQHGFFGFMLLPILPYEVEGETMEMQGGVVFSSEVGKIPHFQFNAGQAHPIVRDQYKGISVTRLLDVLSRISLGLMEIEELELD